MLTATVQHRHNHIQAVRFSAGRLNQTEKILEVVIGRHGVRLAEQIVLDAVVTHINDKIQVHAAYCGSNQTFGIAGRKTGAFGVDQEGILFNTGFSGPFDQIAVNALGQFLRAFGSNNPNGGCAALAEKKLRFSRSHVFVTPFFCEIGPGRRGICPFLSQIL